MSDERHLNLVSDWCLEHLWVISMNVSSGKDPLIYLTDSQVREKVGPEGHVIGAVSGGVDSSVAAVLLQKAIGTFEAVD